MALMIPPELEWLEWVAGSDWPHGNEDKMWAMGDALEEIAKRIRTEGIPALERNLDALAVGYPDGLGREQIDKQLKNLHSGKNGLDQLAKYFDSLAGSADKFGTELNSSKWNGIISLGFLAAELAWAALAGPGAPFAQASAIAATRAAFNFLGNQLLRLISRIVGKVITNTIAKTIVTKIVYEVTQEAVVEVVQGTVQELAVQGINIAGGHQNGIDWGAVGKNAAISALAGGVGGGIGFGLGGLIKKTPLGGQPGWRGAVGGGLVGLGAGAGGALAAMAATGNFDLRSLTGGMMGGVGPSAIYGKRFGAGADFAGHPMGDNNISTQPGFGDSNLPGQTGTSPVGDGSTPPASTGGNSPSGGQQAAAAPSAQQTAPQGAPQTAPAQHAAPSHQAAPSDSSVDAPSDNNSGSHDPGSTQNGPSPDGESNTPSPDQGASPSRDLPGTDPAGSGPNQNAGQPITTNPGVQHTGPGFVGGTDVSGLGGIDPNTSTPVGISDDTAVAPSAEPGTAPSVDPNAAPAAEPTTGPAVPGSLGTGPSTAAPATGANPSTGDTKVGQPTGPMGDLAAHVPENSSPAVDVTPTVDAMPSVDATPISDAQPGATEGSHPGADTNGPGLAGPATTPQQTAGPEGAVPGQSTGVTVPTAQTGDVDTNTATPETATPDIAPETPTIPDGLPNPADPALGMAAAASIPAVLSHITAPATDSAPSRRPGAPDRSGAPHLPSPADVSAPDTRTQTPARQPSPNNDGASEFRPPIPPPAPPLAGVTDVSHGPDRTSIGSDPTTSRVNANLGSDGHFNVIVHADADGNPTVNGSPIDPQTIVNAVRQNDNYTDGTPIRLVACNTGLNPNLVIDIANRLGAPVTAPTDAAGVPNQPNSPVHVRNNGDWITHHPSSTGRPPTITPGAPMPETAGQPDGTKTPDIDYMGDDPGVAPPEDGSGAASRAAEVYQEIAEIRKILDAHPELRGEFQWRIDSLENDLGEARELGDDPDAAEIFDDLHRDAENIGAELSGQVPDETVEAPAYVQENRIPMDHETVLADSATYQDTGRMFRGAKIYRGVDGRYYHRDTFHKGEGAEIEVYDAQYRHIGTMSPSGVFIPEGKVNGRTIGGVMQ